MKKNYVSPLTTEVNFEVKSHILDGSRLDIKDDFVETEGGDGSSGQLTSGNRREWGNLWK